LKETINGFKKIVNGELDHIVEQDFYMAGSIEEVLERAEERKRVG